MTISYDYPSRWFDLEHLVSESLVERIEFRRECASTNDLALASNDVDARPTLFLTDAQTGGRGRGQNRWWARDGALTFSLRLCPGNLGIEKPRWSLISLATAIAVADAIPRFVKDSSVGLKWPNDVQIAGRKVSGILVEVPLNSDSDIVIGVGVNVANSLSDAPDDVRALATSILDETDCGHSPAAFLIEFLQHLAVQLTLLGADSLPLQERWQSQCVLTGRDISLQAADREVIGRCHGIQSDGAIQVETDGVIRPWFGGVVRVLH